MLTKENTKKSLFWIGEHAFDIYKQTSEKFLSNFDNQVLLFSRNKINDSTNIEVTYLDEFFPFIERGYNLEDLKLPIINFFENKNLSNKSGCFIGDVNELITQTTLINTYLEIEHEEIEQLKIEEPLFEYVNKNENMDLFTLIDVTSFSFINLESTFPFKDISDTSLKVKKTALTSFNKVVSCSKKVLDFNDFLYFYEEGIDEVVKRLDHFIFYN